jgi:hypothetical protein
MINFSLFDLKIFLYQYVYICLGSLKVGQKKYYKTLNTFIMKDLLSIAKENTKTIEVATKKDIANSLKEFKKIQAEQTKAKRTEKTIQGDKIKLAWLNDTQSKTALEKYVKNNSKNFIGFLDIVNELNKSNVTIEQVNKSLFKFGYLHELNKLDFEGNIVEGKSFFNIAFMVANTNSLLNRFSKYETVENVKFLQVSKLSTENFLDTKFNNMVKSIIKNVESNSENVNKITEILKMEAIGRNEKAILLKALLDE